MEHLWNDDLRGKTGYTGRKTFLIVRATLSTISPTWTTVGLNACLRHGKPAPSESFSFDYGSV
jgi:hypothetical protein